MHGACIQQHNIKIRISKINIITKLMIRKVLVSAHSKFTLGIARKKGEIDLQTHVETDIPMTSRL